MAWTDYDSEDYAGPLTPAKKFRNYGPIDIRPYMPAINPNVDTASRPDNETFNDTPPPAPRSIALAPRQPGGMGARNPQADLQDQYTDVGAKLSAALQPNPISTPRAILGAVISRRNPQLGNVITGDFQRQRAIQPLMEQEQLLGQQLNMGRQTENQNVENRLHNAQADYFGQRPGLQQNRLDAQQQQKQNQIESTLRAKGLAGDWDENGNLNGTRPLTQEEMSGQQNANVANTQQKTEASKASVLNNQQKLDLARQTLAQRGDYQAKSLALRQQGIGLRTQKAAQEADALGPTAQKTLMETAPVHDQIQDLMQQFDATKNDNTPFKHAADRAKYAVGISSQAGDAADTIAKLELTRVQGAARVLKGSSRAVQALNLAMKHLPNVWVDSDKLIHDKLSNLDDALQQIEDAAYTYGKKSGAVPPQNPTTPAATPPAGAKIRDYTQLGRQQ
jgi:hypothetical protein